MDTAVRYFRQHFQGCTLQEICYIGDEEADQFQEWAEQYDADQAIVLVSTFTVDDSVGDGSLEPNSTYRGWKWVLVRDGNGPWRHETHGY